MSTSNVTEHPPVQPGDLHELQEPPAWPKVVGWISAIWGGLGTCCLMLSGLGAVVGKMFIPPDQASQFPPSFMTPATMVMMVVGLVMSILLCVAGVMTINRKITGRYLHLVYAVISLILVPVGFWVGLQNQAMLEDWIRQNPDTQFAKQQQQMGGAAGQIVSYVFQGIGLLYNLFLIFWFGVVKKTPQSMGAGRQDDDLLDEDVS
ncbi:MAG TPA: hypothetical protein VK176_14275 [Phycisphaerales bacterium]|nr:hypothetical protein [Phycisphaerales bacterium]